MGWFRRKMVEPIVEDVWSTPPVSGPISGPAPAAQSVSTPRGVSFRGTDIDINVRTVEEAKLGIKQLKLEKKEYAFERKGVTNQLAQINAARKIALAGRGSMTRGGGNLGKTIRVFEQSSRDAERRKHAADVAPLDAQKAAIDAAALRCDQAIAILEGFVLEQQQRAAEAEYATE